VPKVTGMAQYGADYSLPGMLWAKILRSPHAHARIRSINTSKAEALPGVKAVLTSADLPAQPFDYIGPERVAVNYWHMTRNILAREKALYEGHAIAAVAATTAAIAAEAIALIEIDYEVLPHVIDVDEAMHPDAPVLFEDMITRGVEPAPTKPSNITKRLEFKVGDLDAGFAEADQPLDHVLHHPVWRGGSGGDAHPDVASGQEGTFTDRFLIQGLVEDAVARADALGCVDVEGANAAG
jgi:CO/xanthine dehydrogenase Mo-binding subunit